MNFKSLVGAICMATISTFAAQQASAVTLEANFTVENNNFGATVTSGLPFGNDVIGSFQFDVDDSFVSTAGLSNFVGSLSWNDTNNIAQTFNITGTSGGTTSSTDGGFVQPTLLGTSAASFGTRALSLVGIRFDIGVNPFTTSRDFSEILLSQGSISLVSLGLSENGSTLFQNISGRGSSSITLASAPESQVSAVPLPAGLPLLLAGLFSFGILRKRAA